MPESPYSNPRGSGSTAGTNSTETTSGKTIYTDFSGNPCVKKIFDALIARSTLNCATTSFLGTNCDALVWNIRSMPNAGRDALTACTPFSQSNRIGISISLNSCMLDQASGVYVAVTMIHEALHAMIFHELCTVGGYTNLDPTDKKLFDKWVLWRETRIGSPQHNLMADIYRQTIINAIKDYDAAFPGRSRSQEELDALSWSGLMETDAYHNFLLISTNPANAMLDIRYNQILYAPDGLRYSKEYNDVNQCITSINNNIVE